MVRAGECKFTAPLKIRLKAVRMRGVIEVSGRVETRVRLSCSRCLKDSEIELSSGFSVTYVDETDLPDGKTAGAEEELSAEDIASIPFRGEFIDLRPVVQEQVVMAFPLRFLCRESCKGLCMQCGQDLNKGACNCPDLHSDHPFAGLKALKP